jgi:hypothetical protein
MKVDTDATIAAGGGSARGEIEVAEIRSEVREHSTGKL